MSIPLRLKRIQRYLNENHDLNISEDGAFGTETLGALELALRIEEWATNNRPDVPVQDQFDDRTEKNLATLDPLAVGTLRQLVSLAMQVAQSEGVVVKVISAHRTWEEQDKLYAKGRTASGSRVTNARGGFSNHNFGIAIDLGVFRGITYLDGSSQSTDRTLAVQVHKRTAAKAKESGLNTEWGGDWSSFKDYPHHELKTGMSIKQKRDKYLEHGSVLD